MRSPDSLICVDPACFDGMLVPMAERPQWLQVQALECIGLALRAKDPRIKRLYILEAQRWLGLAELKEGSHVRDSRSPEYQGVERRVIPRHQTPRAGVILLERAFRIECIVRDFSPAGVGLLLPDIVILPDHFYLTFDYAVAAAGNRGVKFRSGRGESVRKGRGQGPFERLVSWDNLPNRRGRAAQVQTILPALSEAAAPRNGRRWLVVIIHVEAS
jgi:hypothetical protein